MLNLLIKKEYRNKFKFTNYLYNDLWSLCETYFEQIDEQDKNATSRVNAMVACYNIVLYCGRTAIDDNFKVCVDAFIRNQLKPFIEDPADLDTMATFYPSNQKALIVQLFDVTIHFLRSLNAEDLTDNFVFLKQKSMDYLDQVEHQMLTH
ncbi:MAG: hypothetical protein ACNS62_01335 [Candidatus Cyclobacteriaceae bacterium M3_2C_046]